MMPSKTLRVVQGILAWILFLPVFIVIGAVPLLVFFLYRILVTDILRRIFRPDLLSPLTSIDFAFSFDNFHVKPRAAFGIAVTVEGKLNPDKVRKLLSKAMDCKRTDVDYKRLTQVYPTFWMGYPFWTKINRKFQIENHLQIIEEEICMKDVDKTVKTWIESSFPQGQPLWDILLIPAIQGKNGTVSSLLAVRCHHVIGDGLSLYYFGIHEILRDAKPFLSQIQQFSKTQEAVMKLNSIFWTPLILWQQVYDASINREYFSIKKTKDDFFATSITVALSDIKEIRRRANLISGNRSVSFSSVFFLCLSNCLRKIFLNNMGLQNVSKITSHVNISVVTLKRKPHPTHSGHPTFCNHWGCAIMKVPILERDPLKRLWNLVDQERWFMESNSFETNLFILPQLNSVLPKGLCSKFMNSIRGTTCGISILPPILNKATLCGQSVVNMRGIIGLQAEHGSMAWSCFTYQEDVVVSLSINRELFPGYEAQLLPEYFADSLKELKELKDLKFEQ